MLYNVIVNKRYKPIKQEDKTMTKAEKRIIENYNNSASATELWKVYATVSQAKRNAFEYCKRKQYEYAGIDGRIVSFNTFIFTFAFKTTIKGEKYLYYITPSKETLIKLEEE